MLTGFPTEFDSEVKLRSLTKMLTGFPTEFDSVGPCKNTHTTPPESSLGKASFSGKVQNGRH